MDGSGSNRPLAYSYIRMSTGIQLKGHSKQRQLETSAAYAKTHGLELVDVSQLEDIGVSAFKGANVKDGALGQFLAAAENGKVPAGSYLLVKSLDRISRQDILPSLALFLRIIGSGIVLVTLQDEKVYDRHTKANDLIISLTIMSRAHEESRLKSQRVGAAWSNKRSNADKRKLTKWCPAWLRLSNDRSQYEKIPERVAVVSSIFEDTLAGIGGLAITKRLNAKKMPVWGKSKGWHPSYIAKILTNRAVIGEYQPCKLTTDGKRKPDGDPVQDYFPSIIPEELFFRAQQARKDRRITGRGRKGKYVTNLFSGIATCAYCHHPMMFNNKGPPPKGGTFLVCEAAKRGLGCVTTGWKYDHFEASFLTFVERLDLLALIRNDVSKMKTLDQAIQALQGERLSLRHDMETAYQLLNKNSSLDFVVEKLEALQKRVDELDTRFKEKESERQRLEASESEFHQSKEEIKTLIAQLQSKSSEDHDLYKLRSQVAARIKGLVERLEIAPAGTGPIMSKMIERYKTIKTDDETKVMLIEGIRDAKDKRYFKVKFRDGSELGLRPDKTNSSSIDARWESEPLN